MNLHKRTECKKQIVFHVYVAYLADTETYDGRSEFAMMEIVKAETREFTRCINFINNLAKDNDVSYTFRRLCDMMLMELSHLHRHHRFRKNV